MVLRLSSVENGDIVATQSALFLFCSDSSYLYSEISEIMSPYHYLFGSWVIYRFISKIKFVQRN